MRLLPFGAAVVLGVGVAWGGLAPATAAPLLMLRLDSPKIEPLPVEEVGYLRRRYWRHGYAVPYAYYPPAYGYYVPPPAYAYYPPAYGSYAPPPAVNGEYSSGDADYGDYPPANGDQAEYPPENGGYREYAPENGY